MSDTPATTDAFSGVATFPEQDQFQRRLRLPSEFGFSVFSVHAPAPPGLTLPASLGKAVAKRQREYLAGRRCASEALSRAGYPELFYPTMGEDRLPVWPSGWLGSISHSGDHAVAAAASAEHCSALGIDIQEQASEKTMDAIGSMIAKPEELLPINGMDAHAKLLLIFSAKESLYKTLYPQVRKIQEFTAARLIHANNQSLTFELTCDWSSRWKAGTRIGVNYLIAGSYMMTAAYLGIDSPGEPKGAP